MNDIVEGPQPRRIRSFLIKDILEHRNPPEEQEIQLPTNSTEQSAQPSGPSTSYTVQHILGAAHEESASDPCITGCCDCPTVYPTYKNVAVTTPFYNPYLYSFYRQQTAWRQSLKEGVTYVDPQSALCSQVKQRKPRRPWTRAVFSNLQRKGLEKRFKVQKYLTKGDRHQLASMLGLSDNQVKVWFQNRRMKWRQEEQTVEESEKLQEKTEFQTSSSVIAKSYANTEIATSVKKD